MTTSIKCCVCDKSFDLISFTLDQAWQCATFKIGNNLYGEYGSTRHDMNKYEVVVDTLNYPDNSNFCDNCVDVLLKVGVLKWA
jgi:hypothetical protein